MKMSMNSYGYKASRLLFVWGSSIRDQRRLREFYLVSLQVLPKDAGSAHAANLFSTTAKLEWTAGQDHVKSFAVPGTKHTKSFCHLCGSAVPSQQMNGNLLVVPAGSLDSDGAMVPTAHIFFSSKASWYPPSETIEKFEKFPS
jgi:hypothetical protein